MILWDITVINDNVDMKNLSKFWKLPIGGVIFSQPARCSRKFLLMMSNNISRNLFKSLNMCIVAPGSKEVKISCSFSHCFNCLVLLVSTVFSGWNIVSIPFEDPLKNKELAYSQLIQLLIFLLGTLNMNFNTSISFTCHCPGISFCLFAV